ncbi:hypothetical protein HanIR_Chr09g0424781 [Helianthus annuus]|nr:hypothetical protein HanIR_Chr09g0424781 [Helianthus annuus]
MKKLFGDAPPRKPCTLAGHALSREHVRLFSKKQPPRVHVRLLLEIPAAQEYVPIVSHAPPRRNMHPCRTCPDARARAPLVGDTSLAGIRAHLPAMLRRVGTCTLAGHALPRRYTSLLPDECLAKESRTFSLWSAPP